MRRPRGPAALVLLALVTMPACSSSSTPTTADVAAVDRDTPAGDPTEPSPDESASTPPAPSSLAPEVAGLAGIRLTTSPAEVGTRPELTWDPVDDAAYYSLVVSTADGRPYWAWEGTTTSIPLGGLPRLHDDAAGPRLADAMTWVVTAHDADHRVIALSDREPLTR